MTTIGMLLAVGSAFITPLHAEPQKPGEKPVEKFRKKDGDFVDHLPELNRL